MLTFPAIILAITNEDDRDFMKILYLSYNRLMYVVAIDYVDDSHTAEDIVSESCAALIDKIEVLRALNDVKRKRYIITTVRNKARDYLRRQKHYFLTGDDRVFDLQSDDSEIDDRLLLDVELGSLSRALSKIKPHYHEILRLKYSELLSDADISERTNISVSSVRVYLTRARKALREAMDQDE